MVRYTHPVYRIVAYQQYLDESPLVRVQDVELVVPSDLERVQDVQIPVGGREHQCKRGDGEAREERVKTLRRVLRNGGATASKDTSRREKSQRKVWLEVSGSTKQAGETAARMASYTYIQSTECLSDTATSGSTRGGIKGGGKLHTWEDTTSRVSERKRCLPKKEGGIEERQRQALHAKRWVRESNSKRVPSIVNHHST